MANIPHQQAQIGGVVLSATAATAGPDTVAPGDHVVILVENNNASAVVVTVSVPGDTKWGQPEPDVNSLSIPAGTFAVVGPLPRELADPADGLVDISASPSASVNYYAIRV